MATRYPHHQIKPGLIVAGALVTAWFSQSFGQPVGSPSAGAHVQILNGASPHAVSLFMDQEGSYPDVPPGSHITDLFIRNRKLLLKVVKKGTDHEKVFHLSTIPGKSFTLCLIGDFSALPPVQGSDGKKKPDFNIQALLLENEKPEGTQVSVRVVNGLADQVVEIKHEGRSVCRVAGGNLGVASGLPAKLLLQANDGRRTQDLALSQGVPAQNLTVVFFDQKGGLGFRAVTERYP